MQRLTDHPFEPWFLDAIRGARRIVCMTHVDPDADGLGSQIAFADAAARVGVQAVIVNEDPLPPRYSFLEPGGRYWGFEQGQALLEGADLGLIFDAHETDRARRPAQALRAAGVPVLVLDHHGVKPQAEVIGAVATDFSSTGELCFRLIEALGWPLTQDGARGLYAAMSFDTGSFRFLRNRSETLRVAAALLDTGVDTNPIQEALWASRPVDETRLMGRIASRVALDAGGKVAWVAVSAEVSEGLEVPPDAAGEAMPLVIGIEGVLAAAMFKPGRAPGTWKVSLRSKTAVEIGHIATSRGGGGHAHAAGVTIEGPLEAVVDDILADLRRAVGE